MSTLQHSNSALRTQRSHRAALLAAAVLMVAAIAFAVIILASSGGSSSDGSSAATAHPTQAQIQRQLEAVSGARYRQPFQK